MQAPMLEKRDGCGEFGVQRIQAAALQLSQLQNTEKSFCPPRRVHKLTEKERKPAGPKGIPWFSQSTPRESSRDYEGGEDGTMGVWLLSRHQHGAMAMLQGKAPQMVNFIPDDNDKTLSPLEF